MGHDGAVGPLVYRPTFVRVLSVVTWALLALGLVLTTVDDPAAGLRWLPVLAFGAALVHVLFWRPSVEVDDDAVTVRNLVRDVRVPWRRLDSIDTRYALTLFVDERRVSAWAAPAPGRSTALRQSKQDSLALQSLGTSLQHGLRSSATPNSDSGGAALMVKARWERALSVPAPAEAPEVTTRVARGPAALLVVTGVAALVSVLI